MWALWIVFLAHRKDLLALDARRLVYQHVQSYPGLHLREIGRGTGLDPNHAKYHLQYLEKHGMVSSRKEDRYWRFYPRVETETGQRDVLGRHEKAVLALLRRPMPLHVTLLLLDRGEMSHGDILEDLDVSHSTLSYHLKKMEGQGLVEARSAGRQRFFRLRDAEQVFLLLMQYRPPDALVQGFLEAWEALEL